MGNDFTHGATPRDLTALYMDIEQEEKHHLTPDTIARLPLALTQRLFGTQPKGRKRRASPQRNTGRICRQVRDAMVDFLATETEDDILSQLQVEAVTPAPNNKRLRVILSFPTWLWDQDLDVHHTRAQLLRLRPEMRADIAHAIHRRHVPELVLELLQPGETRQ